MNSYEMAQEIDRIAHGLSSNAIEFLEKILEYDFPLSVRQQQWLNDLYELHVLNRGVKT